MKSLRRFRASASTSAQGGFGLAGDRGADVILIFDGHHSISDHGAGSTRPGLRVVFPPSPTADGVLVAARFSRGSRDPAAELPAVVAVADRLGVVSRIALNADAWDARPQRVMIIGHRVVRLDWFDAWDAHTIRLLGGGSSPPGSAGDPPTPFWPWLVW